MLSASAARLLPSLESMELSAMNRGPIIRGVPSFINRLELRLAVPRSSFLTVE